tara:strand:+ start:544 stop:828 length:285 start_codon:yes stop_codon:yes gene_type:complete
MKIIHEKCDPKVAEDRELPYTAYLIEYKVKGESAYDISMADSQVLLFDHYYDKYKKDFVGFKQTEGRLRPNLWNQKPPQRKKKKRTSAQPPREV